jgi:uncharacterized protein (TIGR03435 family)
LQYYDIAVTAQAEGAPNPDHVPQVVKAVLADRFRLKLHRETREVPLYDLVASGGLTGRLRHQVRLIDHAEKLKAHFRPISTDTV